MTELDPLRHRVRRVIAAGTPAQRKELIEAMVAEIRIDGDTVYPIFLVPRDDETPADDLDGGGSATGSHNGAVRGSEVPPREPTGDRRRRAVAAAFGKVKGLTNLQCTPAGTAEPGLDRG